MDHDKLPDPVEDTLECMRERIMTLEEKMKHLEDAKHE